MGIGETYLNIIKAIYDKSTVNFVFNGEKLKAFLVRSETRQKCPFLSLSFNIVLEILSHRIRLPRRH